MKTFEQFIEEQFAGLYQVLGKETVLNEKIFFLKEVIELVDMWQNLPQCNVMRPLPPFVEVIAVFEWLLGYSDFPQRQECDGAYYWRKELRKKLEQLGIDIGGNVA